MSARIETPTGPVDSLNCVFTVSRGYVPGSVQVAVNGIVQSDVTETDPPNGIVTLSIAPITGDTILVSFVDSALPLPPPIFTNTVSIDHSYGLSDALRYMDAGGNPIADAQIRVYLKSDYDARRLEAPVGTTVTTAHGRWQNPILVRTGYNYVVRFEAPNRFGPDVVTITA